MPSCSRKGSGQLLRGVPAAAQWTVLLLFTLLCINTCVAESVQHHSSISCTGAGCAQHGEAASQAPSTAAAGAASAQHASPQDSTSTSTKSSSSSQQDLYAAHAAAINQKAEQQLPRKSSSDKGGYIEFLLFVSSADTLPAFSDPQFSPVVVPIMPPSAGQQQQEPWQLGPAGDMMQLLAQHRAQFLLCMGPQDHCRFLDDLPAQARLKAFHQEEPELTAEAVEGYYWRAIRAPLGGTATEPLLSLFTPAYKSGKKIRIPYESLLGQSYQNWEWVIYDDSPDGHSETWQELSALRDRDVRVRVYKTDRNDAFIGSVKAKACHMATGQLLIELDHDDRLTPDALEILKDALVANPDAGFFYTEAVELFEGTQRTVDYGPVWAYGSGVHYKMLLDGFWATGAGAPALNQHTLRHIVGVPNHVRAWRREAYLAIGGHTRGLPVADDYDLVLRSVFKYPAVYVRHMTYVQYRQLDGSTFTFVRNALIQRLVNILSRHSDPEIHRALLDRGLEDGGRENLHAFTLLWNDTNPTGAPFARYYHQPTVKAPAGQPYFTVVIPTYNNVAQLEHAIESVYAQDYSNWELLIIGDHCPQLDAFMEQQKGMFASKGRIVRYYNMHGRSGPGLHGPLNLAAKGLAPSDWIAYLEDSATWTPEHLKTLAAKVAEDPQRGYVFGSYKRGDKVVLGEEPAQHSLCLSCVAHHRRLAENHGGFKPQAAVADKDNAWEMFSRWAEEPWGATLTPTVVLQGGSTPKQQQEQSKQPQQQEQHEQPQPKQPQQPKQQHDAHPQPKQHQEEQPHLQQHEEQPHEEQAEQAAEAVTTV